MLICSIILICVYPSFCLSLHVVCLLNHASDKTELRCRYMNFVNNFKFQILMVMEKKLLLNRLWLRFFMQEYTWGVGIVSGKINFWWKKNFIVAKMHLGYFRGVLRYCKNPNVAIKRFNNSVGWTMIIQSPVGVIP